MNAAEFIKEVRESDICPADFETVYPVFQRYQQAAIDTLKEFHRVCTANGVSYQLACGSLLGAVRDNGQIPWDYDIDVFVPYHEKAALIKALEKDLSSDFYFYCPEADAKCRHYIMRLAPKAYRTEALHVDVFWLVGLPDGESDDERTAYSARIKELGRIRYKKAVNILEESRNQPKKRIRMLIDRVRLAFTSMSKNDAEFDELCSRYKFGETKYCFATGNINKIINTTEYMVNTVPMESDIGTYLVPENYEGVLTEVYGDFKKIMPLEQRLKEVYHSYNRLRTFDSSKS